MPRLGERRKSFRGVGAAAGAVAALSLPSPAMAGDSTESLGSAKGLSYVSAKLAGVTAQAGPSAQCPGDTTATGGGGSIGKPGAKTILNATYPLSEGSGWQAEGSTTASKARTVTSFGICSADGAVTTSSSSTSLEPGSSLSTVVYCTGGKLPTGGGVSSDGGDVSILSTQAYPGSKGGDPYWANAVQNDGASDASVTNFANCASGLELERRTASAGVRRGETGKVIAKCRAGEAVTGGGLAASLGGLLVSTDAWAVASRPWDSRDDANTVPEDGWLARVHNAGKRIELFAYAVCKQ